MVIVVAQKESDQKEEMKYPIGKWNDPIKDLAFASSMEKKKILC